MKYLGSIGNDNLITEQRAVEIAAEFGLAADEKMTLGFITDPKLEIFSGSSAQNNAHVIASDTDVIFTTNTNGNSYLRLPPNAKNGKRIIIKALQGATNRTITLYPPNDTDGKDKKLIGYANTSPTTSATTVACSYYTCEFVCLISGNTRYWLQISQR